MDLRIDDHALLLRPRRLGRHRMFRGEGRSGTQSAA
jgi:hypothetical protein